MFRIDWILFYWFVRLGLCVSWSIGGVVSVSFGLYVDGVVWRGIYIIIVFQFWFCMSHSLDGITYHIDKASLCGCVYGLIFLAVDICILFSSFIVAIVYWVSSLGYLSLLVLSM